MKKITLAFLFTLCALAAPRAQAPPAASRVTGTITLALDARETPRKLPHLERDASKPDLLAQILAARAK